MAEDTDSLNTLYVTDREQWRAWLAANHKTVREVWLIFYKAHTRRPNIPYDDSVEEALCFGWVDSLIRKLDDDRYARKFTPRTNPDRWSPSNVERAHKMIREGRMTDAGLAVFPANVSEHPPAPRPTTLPLPGWMEDELRAHPAAWEEFNRLPPSHRRNYIGWVTDAKREATQRKRLVEAIAMLERGERLGLK
jgi:uncharacterized protein YdeI (YjbR/CyaY-like superfamily)